MVEDKSDACEIYRINCNSDIFSWKPISFCRDGLGTKHKGSSKLKNDGALHRWDLVATASTASTSRT